MSAEQPQDEGVVFPENPPLPPGPATNPGQFYLETMADLGRLSDERLAERERVRERERQEELFRHHFSMDNDVPTRQRMPHAAVPNQPVAPVNTTAYVQPEVVVNIPGANAQQSQPTANELFAQMQAMQRMMERQQATIDALNARPVQDSQATAVQKLMMANVERLAGFNGGGPKTFESWLQEFTNVCDAATIPVADRLALMHSKMQGTALNYAMGYLAKHGGLAGVTLDQYVTAMLDAKYGKTLNSMQLFRKGIKIEHGNRSLAEFFNEKDKIIHALPPGCPGYVAAAIGLEGLSPFYMDKLQSNPATSDGVYLEYVDLRNRAMSLARSDEVYRGSESDLDKGKGKMTYAQKTRPADTWEQVTKKRTGVFEASEPKKMSNTFGGASGSKDYTNVKCRHCGRLGHPSAVSDLCPQHDKDYIKKTLEHKPRNSYRRPGNA